jgi:hypothetical protein
MSAAAQFDPDAFMAQRQAQPAAPDAQQETAFDPDAFMAQRQTPQQPPDQPPAHASISAQPQPQGIGGKVAQWAQNVMDDIRYGTDLTGVGTVLKKMGAHGVSYGQPEQVGEFMASLPLGLLRAVKGMGEGPTSQGLQDVGGGLLQAGQMPSMFLSPEAGEAAAAGVGAAGQGIATAAGKVADMVPTVEHAGELFQEVNHAARNVPVNLNAATETAQRVQQLAQRGSTMPKVVRDFLKRIADPDQEMMYPEARDFYSNATRIAADEQQKLTPVMRAQLAEFTANLGKGIEAAANYAGKLPEYTAAMDEYQKAMQLKSGLGTARSVALDALKKGLGPGIGGTLGYLAVRNTLDNK